MSDHLRCHLDGAFCRLANRRFTARWVRSIGLHAAMDAERVMATSILLVECAARPRVARIAEWSAALIAGLVGRSTPTITLGPFQQRNGAFARDRAVAQAIHRLRSRPSAAIDPVAAAHLWNGPAAELGGRLPYSEALELARPYALRLVAECGPLAAEAAA